MIKLSVIKLIAFCFLHFKKPSFERGLLPIDLFLRIEQIHRLWDEYDIALQERELAARNETHRLDRLQWSGNRALRDCIQVQAQLTALERRVVEVCNIYIPLILSSFYISSISLWL